MPFKATNILPAEGYDRGKKVAIQTRQLAQNRSAEWQAGANSFQVVAALDNLRTLRAELNSVRSVPGIATYARVQEDDVTYDVVAEFNALVAAIDTAIASISTTLPKDGGGFLLLETIAADGTRTPRTFTPGQLNTIRGNLDAIVAAVV